MDITLKNDFRLKNLYSNNYTLLEKNSSDFVREEVVREVVDESVRFAEESPWPDDNELLKDVYQQVDYPFIID